jgi:hypothetical protein
MKLHINSSVILYDKRCEAMDSTNKRICATANHSLSEFSIQNIFLLILWMKILNLARFSVVFKK